MGEGVLNRRSRSIVCGMVSGMGSGAFCHWRLSIELTTASGKRLPTPSSAATDRPLIGFVGCCVLPLRGDLPYQSKEKNGTRIYTDLAD